MHTTRIYRRAKNKGDEWFNSGSGSLSFRVFGSTRSLVTVVGFTENSGKVSGIDFGTTESHYGTLAKSWMQILASLCGFIDGLKIRETAGIIQSWGIYLSTC